MSRKSTWWRHFSPRANAVVKEKGPAFNRHYMVMWRSQRVWRADHGLECSSAEVQPPYFRRGPSASSKRTRTTLRPQTYRCTTFPGVCTSSALRPMMRLGDEFLVRSGPGLNNLGRTCAVVDFQQEKAARVLEKNIGANQLMRPDSSTHSSAYQ